MTTILGISCYYHDAAAALVRDGDIVAAAQEERFTRKKHDAAFPERAVDFCLRKAGLDIEQIDYVTFYDKPLLKFERLLETYLTYAPLGLRSYLEAIPIWLKQKLHIPREVKRALHGRYAGPILFTEHHESHAASAFFPSGFEEATILTLDGVGEWTTLSIGRGKGNRVELLKEIRFPHSLGLLYAAFTYYTGFKINSGEYKVMGLAPYGEPRFVDLILEHLVDLREDGSFRLDMRYFNYCAGLTMTNRRFHDLFGAPPRTPETPLTQREMDLAASVQKVSEEAMLRTARHAREVAGSPNLCMAGGVALNCVGNGHILRERIFDRIFIQPAAGDAGGALGAALFTWYQYLDQPRQATGHDTMKGSLLGPSFSPDEVRAFLDRIGARFEHIPDREKRLEVLAGEIADGNVIGWFNGRMEFGPRALGARSIIGDARSPKMQKKMNVKIKFRESFRPFAPSVLRERAGDYFDLEEESPYMLLVAPVKEARRIAMSEDQHGLFGIEKLNVPRSDIPAVTHVDYSARVQTVDPVRNPDYYDLIKAFERKTGCGVIVNTSFNIRGEPIVCAPEHAYRCFMATHMDTLVLGEYLLRKADQPEWEGKEAYIASFELD